MNNSADSSECSLFIPVSIDDLRQIINWGECADSEGLRIDYDLLRILKNHLDGALEPKEECRCCLYDCCPDPDHCCQNHTCGK